MDQRTNELVPSSRPSVGSFIRFVLPACWKEYLWYWWWFRNEWTDGLWIDDLLDWFNFYPESATGCPSGLLLLSQRIAFCIIPSLYEEGEEATPGLWIWSFVFYFFIAAATLTNAALPPGSRSRMNEIPTHSPSHSSKWPIHALLRRVWRLPTGWCGSCSGQWVWGR